MEKKQTAVEWLKSQLEQYGSPSSLKVNWKTLDQLIEQAKAMEKEQIIDAYAQGFIESEVMGKGAEQYYNDNFGGLSGMLCGSFEPDNRTSSATKCKCGREKWEHPKPRN